MATNPGSPEDPRGRRSPWCAPSSSGNTRDIFRGVHFQCELHALLIEFVHDRIPAIGEIFIACIWISLAGHRREHCYVLPDLRAGKANYDIGAELAGHTCRALHVLGCSLAYAFPFAIAPDVVAQDRLVAEVDGVIAHCLAAQMVGDRPDLQPVLIQDIQPSCRSAGSSSARLRSKWSPLAAISNPS